MREEVLKILLSLTPQEAVAAEVADGEEYESELTKMAAPGVEKGVNEISAGDKNLDKEFKKDSGTTVRVKKSSSKKKKSTSKKKKKKSTKKRKK